MSALFVGVTMSEKEIEGSKRSDACFPASCGLCHEHERVLGWMTRSRNHGGGGAKDIAGTFDCRALCSMLCSSTNRGGLYSYDKPSILET